MYCITGWSKSRWTVCGIGLCIRWKTVLAPALIKFNGFCIIVDVSKYNCKYM